MANAVIDTHTAARERAAPRRVFVVAGMHRAGTSVVARGLQALGVDLGDRLMSADVKVNARGFFEDLDIVRQDDALLAACDTDWKGAALLDDVDWRGALFVAMRSDARQLLDARLARSGQFGFKDPRVPRLLPFWQAVFADLRVADAYVIAVRHPLSVIASLTARDGLDVRRSGWLWLSHFLCALRYTAGRRRIVVDYDRLLAAPERELARMARGLDLPPPSRTDAGVRTYLDEFLSKELRHSEHAPDAAIAIALPPLARRAQALAQRLACAGPEADDAAVAAEVDALLAELAVHAPLLAYAATVERAADQLPLVALDLAWVRNEVAEAKVFTGDLEAAIRQKDGELAATRRAADEARAAAQAFTDDLRDALRRKEEALAAAQAFTDDLREALRQKDEALGAAQAFTDDLQAALRKKEEGLRKAQRAAMEAHARAQAYADDLQSALGRKVEELAETQLAAKDAHAVAQAYIDDLLAALKRKEGELVAAYATLARIRERVVGRMLLRRIEPKG